MSEKLEIQTQILDEEVVLKFIGSIDEDANFEKVLAIKSKKFIFDFNKIELINSCGIREWINFIDKVDDGTEIIYKNCPQIIIEQMNMVHGFIKKGATVESLYAPYYCDQCDEEYKEHIETSLVKDGKAPSLKCKTCNESMELDAIEEQYFNFLK